MRRAFWIVLVMGLIVSTPAGAWEPEKYVEQRQRGYVTLRRQGTQVLLTTRRYDAALGTPAEDVSEVVDVVQLRQQIVRLRKILAGLSECLNDIDQLP